MRSPTETALSDLVIDWVRKNNLNNGASNVVITEETNLLESGLLDSLGFVDLILFIENKSGYKIDLNDVAPEHFTVIKRLCQVALKDDAKA
jgi:acyl carrier protein